MFGSESKTQPHRVLIASATLLFGKGLRRFFEDRWGKNAVSVAIATTLEETLSTLETQFPDLVILDYDDHSINRERFLNHFVTGERPMRVALISLHDSGAIIVYDRQALAPSQVEDWLSMPWILNLPSKP